MGAASLAALAACGGGDDRGLGPTTTTHTARLRGDPFGLGVASGDPTADSVILWARLAPTPLADDGRGGMPDDPVDVIWEVATDDRFTEVVARGVETALPEHAHSLHVDAGGLDPATDLHYRFRVGEWTSPVGRTRTLPDPGASPGRFGLAVANCQWLETGTYAAYRHMLDEDVDLVVHLGDYIYEYPGGKVLPTHQVATLADYRLRYASYRSDPHLRAAHARFPFVSTWDDHEVQNNHAGDTLEGGGTPEESAELRTAAYRAWWENLPVRLDPPDGASLRVHRHLDVGTLARLYLLDERQHAEEPPCRDEGTVGDVGPPCAAVDAVDRTYLGAEQEEWFGRALAESGATWDLVGNPVVVSGIDSGVDEPVQYMESWDGYPRARARFIEQVAGARNPVVLTGDYHQGMVLDLHERPFDVESEVVAPELMAPPISSLLFSDPVAARTPHLRQQVDAHGYLALSVEEERVTARFRVVDDVLDERTGISTAATWVVEPGERRARPA